MTAAYTVTKGVEKGIEGSKIAREKNRFWEDYLDLEFLVGHYSGTDQYISKIHFSF